ncbi:MAG: ferrichrome ABC transporter permease [Anaerolineae bacterium]|nr:ferrichrome ABC transporter permease [Anaerolineae bacterium]
MRLVAGRVERSDRWAALGYEGSVLVSAMLLFLVQPLIGRAILPWFGGSASVWSATLLFFQVLLLAGYAYSHLLVLRLELRRQIRVHLTVVGVSLTLMTVALLFWETPITPGAGWAPTATRPPLLWVLLVLTVSVGLPYLLLSSTSPLVQAWYVTRYPQRTPYRLYALSNLGSVVALLAYPLLLDPLLPTRGQAWVWSLGYVAFAGTLLFVARLTRQSDGAPSVDEEDALPLRSLSTVRSWWWSLGVLAFSTAGSLLLLSTTSQIAQNVASVPLIWIGPMALYLLTFVIVFSGGWRYSRIVLVLLFVATQIFGYVYAWGNAIPLPLQLGTYAFLLFTGCLVSHGELARLRPDQGDRPSSNLLGSDLLGQNRTAYYLLLATGGALGGVLVNVAAPMLLSGTREYPIAVMACWILAAVAVVSDRKSPLVGRSALQFLTAVMFALGLLSAFLANRQAQQSFSTGTVAAERNFYGLLRVQAAELGNPPQAVHRMVHATTIQGFQFVDPALRQVATAYYSETSGVGLATRWWQKRRSSVRIGVLGLGVGTQAVYGRTADVIRFYEIDPDVIRYAEGKGGYFTYLRDSAATVEIVPGDARLSLAGELAAGGSQQFDLLAVDVYSGDAPPTHLLTLEAFELYLAHLSGDGLLAMHTSTTHLNLVALMASQAKRLGLCGVIAEDQGDGGAIFLSQWVILSRDSGLPDAEPWHAFPNLSSAYDPGVAPWTDSHSNLLQVLR